MTKFLAFLLFYLFFQVRPELVCYDCDPTSAGKCLNPQQDNAKMTYCNELQENNKNIPLPTTSPECFTIQYFKNGNKDRSGLYRGCYWKSSEPTCDHLNKTLKGHVTWCTTCDTRLCNS